MKHKSNKLPDPPKGEDFMDESLWLKAMGNWSKLAMEYSDQQLKEAREAHKKLQGIITPTPMEAKRNSSFDKLRAQSVICYSCKYFDTCPLVVNRFSYDSDEIIFCPKTKEQKASINYLFVKEERINKLSRIHLN